MQDVILIVDDSSFAPRVLHELQLAGHHNIVVISADELDQHSRVEQTRIDRMSKINYAVRNRRVAVIDDFMNMPFPMFPMESFVRNQRPDNRPDWQSRYGPRQRVSAKR